MSDADLATRLAELQKDIDEGRLKPEDVRGDQLDGIEDGTYHAVVNGFEVLDDLQDYPGVVALKTLLMVTSGEHGGRSLEIFMWDILKRDERKLGFLRSHFYNLGVTPLDLTQIQNGSQMFHDLLDVPVEIAVSTSHDKINPKTNKPYRNIYVNRRLDDGDFGTAEEQVRAFDNGTSPVAESTDDIPF